MKTLILLLASAQIAFSAPLTVQEFKKGLEKSTEKVETILHNDIGEENTCLDEYIAREKQLKNWLIWTPPLAIPGVPAGAVAGTAVGAGLAHLVGATSWDALGYVIGGGLVGFGASALAFISVEVISGVKFYKNRKYIHLVVESNANNLEGENVNAYMNKYKKAFPLDEMDIEMFTGAIRDMDASGRLCDGSLLGNTNPTKLKYMLAGKWEIFNTIHAEYASPKSLAAN